MFQLIRKHNLYGVIHEMIEDLVKLDEEQAIALFLEKGDDNPDIKRNQGGLVVVAPKLEKFSKKYLVDPDVVVAKLEKNPKYQYKVSY